MLRGTLVFRAASLVLPSCVSCVPLVSMLCRVCSVGVSMLCAITVESGCGLTEIRVESDSPSHIVVRLRDGAGGRSGRIRMPHPQRQGITPHTVKR